MNDSLFYSLIEQVYLHPNGTLASVVAQLTFLEFIGWSDALGEWRKLEGEWFTGMTR